MKASFKLGDTESVDATLTVTMPVRGWRFILKNMESGGSSFDCFSQDFAVTIRKLLDKATTAVDEEGSYNGK